MKKFLKYIALYIGIVIVFFTLIVGTYALPNGRIRGHIAESVEQLEKEENGYIPFFNELGAMMDTHTDALILNIAENRGMDENENVFQKSVNNSFYESESQGGLDSLKESITKEGYNNHEYSRYWHGIQVIIRPLLLFFNYTEIRYIFMMLILILLTIVISKISKQIGTLTSIALAITLSMMYILVIPASIQYSSILIVTLLSMIAVLELYKHKNQKHIGITFFIIGACATFFDLLTYPLITFGLPLVLTIILENREKTKLSKQIIMVIKLGIIWSLGYAGVFFAKWVIASIILNKNAISLAINQLLFRVNGNEIYPTSRIDTLKINFDYFFTQTARYILIAIFVIWLIIFIPFRKKIKDCKNEIILILIAVIPYIWYIAFSGHSGIHTWFTHRIQGITVFSILSAMIETLDIQKIKTKCVALKEKITIVNK